jgi:hypothetical protein
MSAPILRLWSFPESIEMALRGMDKLAAVLKYLDKSLKTNPRWAYETPRDVMQANLDARTILLKLEAQIYNQAQSEAQARGWL